MATFLANSDRCKLFEGISESIWARIIRKHKLGINDLETAITNDILADILEYHSVYNKNFDVFAKAGYLENIFGSDIDVFIETYENEYRWFALQAKLLKINYRYDTFRDSSDGTMQWDKLKLLERISGCKAYYLLYNGVRDFTYSGSDSCRRSFNEKQFGCSLVEPDDIQRLAEKRNRRGFVSPHFTDIHPDLAEPWRILTCCYLSRKQKLYSMEEIIESNAELSFFRINVMEDYQRVENDTVTIKVSDNRLTNASVQAKWDAKIRLIIKHTY